MEILVSIFGDGRNLNFLQMSARGIIIFIVALLLIRISGRRSFGLGAPLDNIITILLGAILSRAVVGSSPFLPVIISCLVIVLFHRFFCWLLARSKKFSKLVEGEKILLFKDGEFISGHLKRAQMSQEDAMQGVRRSALTEDLSNIEHIYIERNGEISAIRKKRH